MAEVDLDNGLLDEMDLTAALGTAGLARATQRRVAGRSEAILRVRGDGNEAIILEPKLTR